MTNYSKMGNFTERKEILEDRAFARQTTVLSLLFNLVNVYKKETQQKLLFLLFLRLTGLCFLYGACVCHQR